MRKSKLFALAASIALIAVSTGFQLHSGFLSASSAYAAQSSSDHQSIKAAPHKTFMWKVSSDKGTIYLLGSIHLVPPDFYPLPAEVEKAFDQSSDLVLEADDTKVDPLKLQTLMLSKSMYQDGDNLQNHLSKDTLAALQQYCEKSGQAADKFMTMRPWFVGMMIPLLELQRQGFDAKLGIDKHFQSKAQESGKAVGEVESAEFQMELISSFPDDLQEKLLKSSLLDVQDTKKEAAVMTNAWKNGNVADMELLVTKDEREHPELKVVSEKLIYDRNVNMEKKIEEYLDSGKSYFVVVGAGHLVGDRGIIKMLKDKKYTVEQVIGAPAPTAKIAS